jgi:CHC2 zinc finger
MISLWAQGPPDRAAWAAKAHAVRVEDELARRGFDYWTKPRHSNIGQPCLMCGGTDRFSVNTKKQVFLCRRCNAKGDVINLVQALDGVGYLDAISTLAGAAPIRIDYNIPKQPALVPKQRKEELPNGTGPLALALWWAARDPRGTIAETYLRSRGLDLPDEAAGDAIRFHPNCPFGEARHPAMICLVRNIITNEPQAIHRTALMPDGTAIKHDDKTFRLTLGPTGGGAIKLDPDENITKGLCVGEGVETCLAGLKYDLRPVWSLISTGGIAKFPVLPGIECLTIFRENDEPNARAVAECADRWLDAGREVIGADPPPDCKDINNLIVKEAQNASHA